MIRLSTRVGICLALAACSVTSVPAAVAATGGAAEVSGHVWYDVDGDGVREASEEPLADQVVWLHDAAGQRLGGVLSDASGRYAFGSLAGGTYTLRYGEASWQALWDAWVPSTTGNERPESTVSVSGATRVDFGWRPLVTSTDAAHPLSRVTTSTGLEVASYNDAVTATDVAAALARGSLLGAEGEGTTIRFGLGGRSYCASSVSGTPGTFGNATSTCYVDYRSWLEQRDAVLFHEYGHAWASYHDHVTQQDGDFSSYLVARGLAGDPRVGSGYAWYPEELIAEDYRQLFGSVTARQMAQLNGDIAPAADVPGLAAFLSDSYAGRPAPADAPPAVSVVDPAEGSSVSGTAVVTVAARDDRDATSALVVEVSVDGGPWQRATFDAGSSHHRLAWDTTLVAEGAHRVVARALDLAGQTGVASPVVVEVVHEPDWAAVGDLDARVAVKKSGWTATVTVAVTGAGGPVGGAVVTTSATTSRTPTTATCTTAADGRCTVTVTPAKSVSSVVVAVEHVSAAGLSYDSGRNTDADADSDGTRITVSRPA